MARSNSYVSSGASLSPQLLMPERFPTFQAPLDPISKTRLQQQGWLLSMFNRDSNRVISTAISATGWLVAATSSKVRLYDLDHQDHAHEIKPTSEFSIKMQSKNEKVRSIAVSDELLAVVTHYRLIVYEYREAGNVGDNVLERVRLDQNETWAPKSVSIMQVKSLDTHQSAAAWIAVGGQGVNGVKLFQYSRMTCWDAQRNFRTTLKCAQNTSSLRSVGFSQFVRKNKFIVFGVTSDNRIFCWDVRPRESAHPVTVCDWELDSGSRQNTSRGKIASVSIFESPSGKPYIFCAVDQRHGAQMPRSFIAPLEKPEDGLDAPTLHWRALPENVTGRYIHTAAVTSNGRFLATVEKGMMRLFALRGAYEGGLTCQEHTLKWDSTLGYTAKEVSGISLSMREREAWLEIYAVDGRGHILFARVSVPDMPAAAPPSLSTRPRARTPELPAGMPAAAPPSLSRRPSAMTPELPADSIVGVPGMPAAAPPSLSKQPSAMAAELPADLIVRELSADESSRLMRFNSSRLMHFDSIFQSKFERFENEIKGFFSQETRDRMLARDEISSAANG